MNADIQALEEMLKFLIQKFKDGDEGAEVSTEGEPMAEEGLSEEPGMEDSIEEITDDYIKPENREVRMPKHLRPKNMSLSLAELAVSKQPKKDVSLDEAIKARSRRRGR